MENDHELFLDFGLATTEDVPALLEEYVHYFNNRRRSAALGNKSRGGFVVSTFA